MKTSFNNIKITVLFSSVCLFLLSCTKGFDNLNKTPGKVNEDQATVSGLFNYLELNATTGNDDWIGAGVSLWWDYNTQQAVQNKVTLYTRASSDLWNNYYPFLFNYRKLVQLIDASPVKSRYTNAKYMADILLAAKTLRMLDYYGDIPYSDAGKAEDITASKHPKYDKQAEVYKSVLADLKAAADGIIVSGADQESLGSAESILKSDYAAWIRFATAIRLRYAVRLFNVETALSSTIITEIIAGNKPLPKNQAVGELYKNNIGFWPSAGTIYPFSISDAYRNSFAEASITELRMSSNVWNQMASGTCEDGSCIFDPRTKIWFAPNNAGKWIPQPQDHSQPEGGRPYPDDGQRPAIGSDAGNRFASFNVDLVYTYNYFPTLIITEADVYFLIAEIYQRGMAVPKDIMAAKAAYEAGIKSSIDFWYGYVSLAGVSSIQVPDEATKQQQLSTMLTQPSVVYDGTDEKGALKKIATQAWLAALWESSEAWAIGRRTGLTPKDPTYKPASVANKLPYPDDERLYNFANWQAALGGTLNPDQQLQIKVYWMPK